MKRAIIIQGPTNVDHIKENKNCWKNNTIIFSTWIDSDKFAYDLKNDIVLFNEYPLIKEPHNWGLQRLSTLNALRHAKELGYNRALKWRSDFKTNNADELLKLFKLDKINFYAFMNYMGGYFTDFFMEGDIDELIDIFNTDSIYEFPEKIITNRIYELGLEKKSNFVVKELNDDVDVYWHKFNYWLSVNKTDNNYMDKIHN